MENSVPLIEFDNVYKIYQPGENEVRALDGVSMKIYRGEFVAIVGQSGSGKSTCMNILGCLDVPTEGRYLLAGHDVGILDDNSLAEIRNTMLGFVFQQYNLLPKMTVLDNVKIGLIYGGVSNHECKLRARAVLERVGLSDKLKNRPNQLSGGQQQRVSIARALAGNPSVILADEPTGALDSQTGKEVIRLLNELNREGNTVIIVTHNNAIAAQARRIIRLEDGRIKYDGVPDAPEVTAGQPDAEEGAG